MERGTQGIYSVYFPFKCKHFLRIISENSSSLPLGNLTFVQSMTSLITYEMYHWWPPTGHLSMIVFHPV